MKAHEYLSRILSKTGADRELEALAAFKAGEMPDGLLKRSWPTVTIKETIDGAPHTLELLVAPNFLAAGEDESAFHLPMWPTTAQKIADSLYAVLPTRKIADAIFKAAETRVSLDGVQPAAPWYDYVNKRPTDGGASAAWDSSNKKRQEKGALRYDRLVDGHAKSLVISPKATGDKVLIYGAMNGVGGFPLQGLSDFHVWHYVDYSHGVRLVSRRAKLDGKDIDLRSVFLDPKLSALVTDGGPFEPTFPINSNNVGAGAPPIPKGGKEGIIPPSPGTPSPAPGKPPPVKPPPTKAPVAAPAEQPSLALPVVAVAAAEQPSLALPVVAVAAAAIFFLTR
jgi:hypothetical protein